MSSQVAGSVVVEVRGDLGDFEAQFRAAERVARSFELSMGRLKPVILGTSSGTKQAAESAATFTAALDRLRAKYNPLAEAGAQYKAQLDEIKTALGLNVISQKQAADAVDRTKRAFADQVRELSGYTARAQEVAAGHERMGRAAQEVRAQIDPLGAAIDRETAFIQRAVDLTQRNILTQRELNDVMHLSEARLRRASNSYAGFSFEAKNLSYQLVDVTQGLASGIPVFQIFAQQAAQIGQVIATSPQGLGGLLKEIGGAFAKLLTPVRLAAVGLIAAGVGAYASYQIWKSFALALDDTARAANTTTKYMSALQAAASFKGIGQDSFVQASGQFAANLYQAQHHAGSLANLLHANGRAAKDFDTTLGYVADLIAGARGNTQQQFAIMRQAGIPATAEWLRLLEGGSRALRDAREEAASFGSAANDSLVKKARAFDEVWNKSWGNFKLRALSAIAEVWFGLSNLAENAASMQERANQKLVGKLAEARGASIALLYARLGKISSSELTQAQANKFYDLLPAAEGGTKPPPKSVDPEAERQAIQLTLQRIQALGELATVEQQVYAAELQLKLQRTQPGTMITDADVKRIMAYARANAEWARIAQQAQVGVFRLGAAEKYAADQLKVWIDQKLVDPKNPREMAAAQQVLADRIRETGNQAALAASPMKQLKQLEIEASDSMKLFDSFGASTLGNLSSSLVDIATGAVSAGEGFRQFGLSVVKALAEMIVKMTIIAPLAKLLSGTFGLSFIGFATGGAFDKTGSLYASGGVFGAPARFAAGGAFTNSVVSSPTLFKFARGGGPGLGLMGEAGPEAIMPLRRAPNGQLGVTAITGGGGGASVVIHSNPTFYNADPASEARIRAFIVQSNRETLRQAKVEYQKMQLGYK